MTSQRLKFRGFKGPRVSKYGSRRCEYDGQKFDSMKECDYYKRLKLLQRAGDVLMFLRQVPFHIPGDVKYLVDFQIFWASGEIGFVDVKGFKTAEYKLKKKLVEHHYPIVIEEA